MRCYCMWGFIHNLPWMGTLQWTHDSFCCSQTQLLAVVFPSHLGRLSEMTYILLKSLFGNLWFSISPWMVRHRCMQSSSGYISSSFVAGIMKTLPWFDTLVFGVRQSFNTRINIKSARWLARIVPLPGMKWAIFVSQSITISVSLWVLTLGP